MTTNRTQRKKVYFERLLKFTFILSALCISLLSYSKESSSQSLENYNHHFNTNSNSSQDSVKTVPQEGTIYLVGQSKIFGEPLLSPSTKIEYVKPPEKKADKQKEEVKEQKENLIQTERKEKKKKELASKRKINSKSSYTLKETKDNTSFFTTGGLIKYAASLPDSNVKKYTADLVVARIKNSIIRSVSENNFNKYDNYTGCLNYNFSFYRGPPIS